MSEVKMNGFAFIDLSMIGESRRIDGMAAGSFVDMWGRETVFEVDELPLYVVNTKRALESTRGENGEIVGFPIDRQNHDGGLAAGWITDVSLAEGRAVIEFDVRWNEAGKSLIGSDDMRFFSPTVDTDAKVIIGGSLTNWPATRTADHQILLRPVELSASMQTCEPPAKLGFTEAVKQVIDGVIAGLRKAPENTNPEKEKPQMDEPEIVELAAPQPQAVDLSSPEATVLIQRRAEEIAAEQRAAEQRAAQIADFAAQMTGRKSRAIPVEAERLSAFLTGLTDEQRTEAQSIFTRIADNGLVDFSENGHSAVLAGVRELPSYAKPLLTKWLASGNAINEFFLVNAAELGDMGDYNLLEFTKEK